jgi:hypothetical protein
VQLCSAQALIHPRTRRRARPMTKRIYWVGLAAFVFGALQSVWAAPVPLLAIIALIALPLRWAFGHLFLRDATSHP